SASANMRSQPPPDNRLSFHLCSSQPRRTICISPTSITFSGCGLSFPASSCRRSATKVWTIFKLSRRATVALSSPERIYRVTRQYVHDAPVRVYHHVGDLLEL